MLISFAVNSNNQAEKRFALKSHRKNQNGEISAQIKSYAYTLRVKKY